MVTFKFENGLSISLPDEGAIDMVQQFVAKFTAGKVVVMCGAGISVSAGIPDFRSPGTGLYDNLQKYNLPNPQSIFTLDYFEEHPEAFYTLAKVPSLTKQPGSRKELYPGTFCPTITHFFFKLLADKGKLLRVFTQNIDSLEAAAGLDADRIVAAHGNFDAASCIKTGEPVDVAEVKEAIMAGETGWRAMAERHGGLVKPDIVFFGENLPARFFELMKEDLPKCDLLIVLGTSLVVHPFASLLNIVPEQCPRVLINREEAGVVEQPQRVLKQHFPQLFGSDAGFDFDPQTRWRDVAELADIDTAVRALARKLGWLGDLEKLYADGQAAHAIVDGERGVDIAALPEFVPGPAGAADVDAAAAVLAGVKLNEPTEPGAASPAHVSGFWIGQLEVADGTTTPLRWVLSLGVASSFTAFGCGVQRGAPGTSAPQYDLLYGKADLTTGVVELECKPQPGMVEGALRPTTKFEGALARAEGGEGWKLTGKCESGGTFRVELVPEGSDHFSGLWRGEAIPDPSFDRVDVPTNPITWALSYGFDSLEPGFPPIVGAGYFDDAADIPDDPILGYTLRGDTGPGSPSAFTKVYADPVPAELTVKYSGVKLMDADGRPYLSGNWFNALEATHGVFAARLEEI